MNENQLRLRHISDYKTTKNSQKNSQTNSHTMSSRTSDDQRLSDPNHTRSDSMIENEIDDRVCDNENENLIKKFSKNEKQGLIDLLYSEDVIKFSKINSIEDSSESDAADDEMTTFINDRKPLLNSIKKTKRKSVGKPFRSEVLYSGFEEDSEDHIVYDESLISLFFQVFVPFLIAGFGTVGAGLVLDYVQVLILAILIGSVRS